MLEIKKYGRLTPIKIERKEGKVTYWLCQCDCGNTKAIRENHIKYGHTKSCGCLKIEKDKYNNSNKRHGLFHHRIYSIWQGMKTRCYNPNAYCYVRYGERGIKICDEWKDNVENFYKWAIENGYQEDLTIDRIDVNGNYEPDNCQWITLGENVAKRFKDENK